MTSPVSVALLTSLSVLSCFLYKSRCRQVSMFDFSKLRIHTVHVFSLSETEKQQLMARLRLHLLIPIIPFLIEL
jgi:hypothetical protein